MNKFFFNLFFVLLSIPVLAEIDGTPTENQLRIKGKYSHNEWNIPADMPDVYYNYVTGIITIVDYVTATYYVTIYDEWWNVVITDTKVGGGTIDVSSLSSGDYVIEITTSWNHEYEGEFTVP